MTPRPTPSPSVRTAPPSHLPPLGLPVQSDALSILERLLQECHKQQQASQQIQVCLEALRESTGADTVLWYPGQAAGDVVVSGRCPVPVESCKQLIAQILDQRPGAEERVLWTNHVSARRHPLGALQSAALLRVTPSQPPWIVALSFNPARLFTDCDLRLLSLVRTMLLHESKRARIDSVLKESFVGLIRCLTATIDAKDPFTCSHSERVARIAVRIGSQMKLPGKTLNELYLAGLLHDVGKIGIQDTVLMHPGKLTPEHFTQMKEHVLIGDRIVSSIKQFSHLRAGVRNHHEHFDGSGYPDRLARHEIPLLARILAVADSCDAMMSPRRYRAALTPPHIDATFVEYSGRQWDPEVIDYFMECRRDIYPPIYSKGLGDSACFAIEELLANSRD